ncbi:MAG: hypothetical protein ABIP51_18460, partial [Bacteroidia bacterium]
MNLINALDKFSDYGFYISQGGLGDMLLTLSSVCKNQNNFQTNIVSFADDELTMRLFLNSLKEKLEIKKTLIFRGGETIDQYNIIVNHPNFRGKAHLADNLDFYNEWDKNPKKYR